MKHPGARKNGKTIDRQELCAFLSRELAIDTVPDSSCNGLQIEGAAQISRVGLAVDACMESYRKAVEKRCELLLVHHGIIWGGLTTVSGSVYTHIRYCIEQNLNLFAAHLPLDRHPVLGNNAQLAALLSVRNRKPFGLYKNTIIGFEGTVRPTSLDNIVDRLCRALFTECTVLPFGTERVRWVAIISGGGSDELNEAVEKGIDCFITGESSHQNYHTAMEAGINVIYAGHYHTETLGVRAVGRLLESTFGIATCFIDIPTVI